MKNFAYILFTCYLFSSCADGVNETESNPTSTDSTEISKQTENTPYTTITYTSLDGLEVTGNLYEAEGEMKAPILLCHQAQFNKFEYAGIAERLVGLGYTCLAIDQRSGGPIANQQNETYLNAQSEGKGIDYLDAKQDITAGVNFLSQKYDQPIILWGSSYSSTLVLYEAVENENVASVVSFSPGDYFADTLGSLVPMYVSFEKPMFLTSGSWEVEQVSAIVDGKIMGENQVQFVPEGTGHHGSRALWVNQNGGEEYWVAIEKWLSNL